MLSASIMFEWLADRYNDEKLTKISKLMEESILKSMKEGYVTPERRKCHLMRFARHFRLILACAKTSLAGWAASLFLKEQGYI